MTTTTTQDSNVMTSNGARNASAGHAPARKLPDADMARFLARSELVSALLTSEVR